MSSESQVGRCRSLEHFLYVLIKLKTAFQTLPNFRQHSKHTPASDLIFPMMIKGRNVLNVLQLSPNKQCQAIGLRVKSSIHCEELSRLDISGLYLLLWPGYYTSGVSGNWQVIHINGSNVFLPIQLTLLYPG